MRILVAILTIGLGLTIVGCGKSQSANCKKLIACTEALNPGTGTAMEASYGASGACWKDGAAADACIKACDAAIEGLKASPEFANKPACK